MRDRQVLLLWLVAIGDIIGVGLTTIAQPRYIFFGITLLVILGVDELRRWIEARPPRPRRMLGYAAVGGIALAWVIVLIGASVHRAGRSALMTGTLAAVPAIRRDAGTASCQVLCRHTTQLEWYTGCRAILYPSLDAIAVGEPVYVVRDATGGAEQPNVAEMPGHHRTIVDVPSVVQVIRLEP
jgi:hypothetical protein